MTAAPKTDQAVAEFNQRQLEDGAELEREISRNVFPEADPDSQAASRQVDTQQIARLAYALWEERGCPTDGSDLEDWLAAERQIARMRDDSDGRL